MGIGHNHDHGGGQNAVQTATGSHRRRLMVVLGIYATIILAQIVGAGLESESYYRHAHAPEIREESARFINKLYTLFAVDIDSRFYCLELHSGVVALEIERLCILREAAAAVAYSGF